MRDVRIQRVGEQIKKELSQIFQQELKDPRIGFVTVTGVEVTGDLQLATVYLSILGEGEERNRTLDGLEKAKGYIRTEVGRRIRLKHTPEIQFKEDKSLQYSDRIEQLLKEVKRDE